MASSWNNRAPIDTALPVEDLIDRGEAESERAAREAQRAGIPMGAFLRARLDRYLGQLRPVSHPLPERPAITGEGVEWEPNSARDEREALLEEAVSSAAGQVRVLAAAGHEKPRQVVETVAEARGAAARAGRALEDAEADLASRERRLQDDVVDGRAAGRDGDRPGTAGPARGPVVAVVLGYVAIAVCVLFEAGAFAPGYLDQVGVDVGDLWLAWQANALGVCLGAGFALAAAAAIFLGWSWWLDGVVTLLRGSTLRSTRGPDRLVRLVGSTVLLALVLGVSWGIAGARHGLAEGAGALESASQAEATTLERVQSLSPATFFLLTLLVPLVCAHLHRCLRKWQRACRRAASARRSWARRVGERMDWRARREEVVTAARRQRDRHSAEQAAANDRLVRHLSELERAERELRDRVESERAYVSAFTGSMRAALSEDGLVFLRERERGSSGEPRPDGAHSVLHVAGAVILAAFGLLSSGCTGRSAEALHAPTHVEVACSVDALTGEFACDASEREAALDEWLRPALRRPGSTFTLRAIGEGWDGVAALVAVPDRWGGGVLDRKAAFSRAARDAVRTARPAAPTRLVPASAVEPGLNELGVTAVVTLGGLASLDLAQADAEPLHLALVCDRSDSSLESTCDSAVVRQLAQRWVTDSGAVVGSSLDLWVVGRSADTAQLVETVRVPAGRPGARLAYALSRGAALGVALPEEELRGASAIVECLGVAWLRLREREGRHALLILSDMRQYTRGRWNFEAKVPSASSFGSWLDAQGLLQELDGTEVLACGLHHATAPGSPPFDTRRAVAVEELWSASLELRGAGSVTLRRDCEDLWKESLLSREAAQHLRETS